MRIKNPAAKSIKLLGDLAKNYPQCTLGQHIVLAFGEFNSMDCMSELSFYETLFDYHNSLELMEFYEDIDADDELEPLY
jgi:hypothetical protein